MPGTGDSSGAVNQGESAHFLRSKRRVTALDDLQAVLSTRLHLSPDELDPAARLYELGVDSLTASHLKNHIEHRYGVTFSLSYVLSEATLDTVVDRILDAGPAVPLASPLVRVERTGAHPLSNAQERMWFLEQLEPDRPIYNVPDVVHVQGPFNMDAFTRSIQEIIRRHEVLRTTFTEVEGRPQQRIADDLNMAVSIVDLRHLVGQGQETEVRRLADEDSIRPFNLEQGPILRVTVLQLSATAHVLLVTMHHCAADVVSLQVFLDELEVLYGAYSRHGQSPLKDPAIQYLDYAVWHRNWLAGGVRAQALGYWVNRLAGAPHTLDIPTDHPRPAVQSFRGAGIAFELDAETGERLAALARREGITRFMVLAAAWQLLLHRYSGQATVLVGFPIANRSRNELEGLIGYFANTVVLRTDFTSGLTGRGLLEQVKAAALAAFDHQDVPFEDVVEAVRPPRDLSRMPLVQSMFVLNKIPRLERRFGDVSCTRVRLTTTTAKVDVAIAIDHSDSGFRGEIQYSTDLFDAETIRRMAGHYQTLIDGLLEQPDCLVSHLPMLTEQESNQQLHEWNSTPVPVHPNDDVGVLLEERAAKSPFAVAATADTGRISYAELCRHSADLAGVLRDVGVQPGETVAVYLERTLGAVQALVGIQMAGASYVPMDPGAPIDRVLWQLDDCAARVVITDRSLRHRLSEGKRKVICLDELAPGQSVESRTSGWDPASPAYVLYTSGSTGKPKGVVVTRANLLHTTLARVSYYREPVKRLLLMSPFTFDVASGALWWTLCTGGTVVLASEERGKDVDYLRRMIRSHRITHMMSVPTVYQALLQECTAEDLESLETVIVGGEVLTRELAGAHQDKAPRARLFNEYGPTEASVWATVYEVPKNLAPGSLPIGRPIPNAFAYVLDAHRQLLPVGVPGELYLGGAGVARGYLNRPDLDARQFVQNPFRAGERLYRTGDLARYRADGLLEFVGRIDRQVKLRGVRVELEEIESVLSQHPEVGQVAVVLRGSSPQDHRLVAYVLPKPGHILNMNSIERHAKKYLPPAVVPAHVVGVSELPLLSSGKVDLGALPQLSVESDQPKIAAGSPIERAILEIWKQVLPEQSIGITDNFFQLGGHSLLATQVISRLRDMVQVEIAVRAMFEHPTIQQLSRHVELLRRDSLPMVEPPIVPLPRDRPFPLSYSQQRMWFMYQLAPEGTAYNMPFAIRLKGEFDRASFKEALNQLGRRHESFRTTFRVVRGEPVQIVDERIHMGMEEVDLRLVPEVNRVLEARKLIEHDARKPFDLADGPLTRALLMRLGAEDTIVLLHMHHVVADQWSAGIIGKELVGLYNCLRRGKPSALPPLPVQYADYAAWQRQVLRGEGYDRLLRYWRQKLAGVTVLSLPLDFPRPGSQTYRGTGVMRVLPQRVLAAVRELSWKQGATTFMTLMACFKILLSRYSGVEDIAIGSPIANRTRTATEGLIGTLVNTLVMRTDLSGDPTFIEVLQRVKRTALEAYDHQDMPFEKLVDELQVKRDNSHSPLIQVFFNVPNAPMGDMAFDGLAAEPFDFDRGAAQFDLSLTVETELYGRIYLEYATDLFARDTAERLVGHFISMLEQIVAEPQARLSSIRLLTAQEEHIAVRDWNRTDEAYDEELCVPELVSAQAGRTPAREAVRMGGASVTYQELDRKSNQWARHLLSLGVRPGALVGLCLDRSIEMVIGLLAIQKVGAAYVPLDPDYPKERIRYMVSDAEPAVLLTESRQAALFSDMQTKAVLVDQDGPALAAHPPDPLHTRLDPEALAYVLYTSGSTGKPKGVEIRQRSLGSFLRSMAKTPGCGPDDLLLSVTTLSFDIAGLELYLPLTTGGCVELVERSVAANGQKLRQRMEQTRPTLMQATPATWRMLIDAGWEGDRRMTALCGGEALASELAAKLLERVGSLWNMYGPTETTIWSTCDHVESGDDEITIGRPIANTEIYVLDRNRHIAPVGVPGELYIGGIGLAKGYYKRPDLTAERFIPHPYSSERGARLYRTGDLARYRSDGKVVHLGRLDHQVKIRGFRIELGEVQSAVARHPEVRHAVVTAREDSSGSKQLVAYIEPKDSAVQPQAIREFVKRSLPEYMVPAHVVSLSAFPLTPNGKVDVKALPAPESHRVETVGKRVEPKTPLEIQLAALWQQVLDVAPIGMHDNFFDLGGHSLKAVQLFAHLEQVFGRQLPLATLFQAPTIAQLAAVLTEKDWTPPWGSLVAIQPGGSAVPLFAVPGVGGNVLMFAKLAKLLGSDQPVYGLQPIGLDGKSKPLTSVVDIATRYVEEIRTVCPRGPYLIAGTCTGGVIAFEMAQQLISMGEQIELIIMETWHPSSYPDYRKKSYMALWPIRFAWSRAVSYAQALRRLPPREWIPFVCSKLTTLRSLTDANPGEALEQGSPYRERLVQATLFAVANYQTTAYPGRLLNIVASRRPVAEGVHDTRTEWEALARHSGRTCYIRATDSGRLFVSPHVEDLSRLITQYVSNAFKETASQVSAASSPSS